MPTPTIYGRYPSNNGVSSLNSEIGAIDIVAGPGITVTPAGQTIIITNTEAAAPVSIGPLDSQPENANGLAIAANILSTQSADTTHPGVVNNTTQSFSGNKTFTGSISASNLSGTNTGDVTLGTANGLGLAGQVLSLGLSSTSTTGALSSTDWNTFNNKQAAGSFVTTSEVGAANGVASLDGAGKVPVAQLPSAVMQYEGAWNPNTNSPTLSDGTGTNGNVYYVTALRAAAVSGLTDPSMVNFQIGDLVIYSSSIGKWQLVTPAAGVQSVNSLQGVVTINAINQLTGDITAGPASGSQSVAASLVATTNNTLTTLSSLSLPGSQITGNISGNASNITASSNSTLTTLSALSLPFSQVTGIVPVTQGGTSLATLTANNVILGNGTSNPLFVAPSTSGNVLTSNGTTWTSAAPSAGSATGLVASAFISSATSSNVTRSNATLGSFGTNANIPSPTLEFNQTAYGTLSVATSQIYAFTITNLVAGYYRVSFDLNIAGPAVGYSFLSIGDGTTTSGRFSCFNASTSNPGAHVEGYFNYSGTASQTFEIFGAAAAGITIQNDTTNQQVYFSITKVG